MGCRQSWLSLAAFNSSKGKPKVGREFLSQSNGYATLGAEKCAYMLKFNGLSQWSDTISGVACLFFSGLLIKEDSSFNICMY